MDWAFNLLVKLSAVCPEHYSLAFIPPLTDAILEHAVPFFRWVDSQRQDLALRLGRPVVALPAVPLNGMFHALPGFSPEQLERTMQVYHIFRNFSFLEANMKILLNHPAIVQLVEYGLIIAGEALPTTEIKRYALDIYENTSREIRVRSADDRLFVEIMRLLYSDDRAMVVGSVRSLTNLCTYSLNEELFSTVNVPMVERMLQLLLAGDEQVVSAVMEFLYQYTRLYEKAAQRIAEISKTNVVRLLSKFLGWKGRPRPANQPAPAPTPLAANVMTAPPSVIARGGLPPTVNRPQEQSSAPSQTSTAVDTFRKSATAEQMHCMNW